MRLLLLIFFLLGVCANAQIPPAEQLRLEIARKYFPAEIVRPDMQSLPRVCATGFPSPESQDFLVAGYTDGAVQMLKRQQDDTYERVALFAGSGFSFFGFFCRLDLVDLDDDGTPEILFALDEGGTGKEITADWYFRWSGTDFVNLTPVIDGDSQLIKSYSVDIDLDGKLEVIGLDPEPGGTLTETELYNAGQVVYSLTPKGLHRQKAIYYSEQFKKAEAGQVEESTLLNFRRQPAGELLITIVNGSAGAAHRLSSAIVELNGEQVIAAGELNPGIATLTKRVQLKRENDFRLRLDGPPGSTLILVVEPKADD
jgi:hypothetical protein